MNNKPVAWMSAVNGETVYVGYEPAEGYLAIPLYTHPVKELTDEEIMQQAQLEDYKKTIEWLADINEMRFLELTDGELPVLYVTLNHNGNRIQGNVSLQETRLICNSIAEEIKKKSKAILRKAQEK